MSLMLRYNNHLIVVYCYLDCRLINFLKYDSTHNPVESLMRRKTNASRTAYSYAPCADQAFYAQQREDHG